MNSAVGVKTEKGGQNWATQRHHEKKKKNLSHDGGPGDESKIEKTPRVPPTSALGRDERRREEKDKDEG